MALHQNKPFKPIWYFLLFCSNSFEWKLSAEKQIIRLLKFQTLLIKQFVWMIHEMRKPFRLNNLMTGFISVHLLCSRYTNIQWILSIWIRSFGKLKFWKTQLFLSCKVYQKSYPINRKASELIFQQISWSKSPEFVPDSPKRFASQIWWLGSSYLKFTKFHPIEAATKQTSLHFKKCIPNCIERFALRPL